MEWSIFILSLIALYGGLRCYRLSRKDARLKFLGFSIALLILAFTQIALLIDQVASAYEATIYSETILEWGHVLSLSFVLSSLAIFIRQSKPAFAQFPRIYAILPFFIVLSYFLVKDTYAIKDWLITIYQGGAILIGLLMYSVYTYRNRDFMTILAGIILLLITFVLFWYVPVINESFAWIWRILLGVGILTIIYGYDHLKPAIIDNKTISTDPQPQQEASL